MAASASVIPGPAAVFSLIKRWKVLCSTHIQSALTEPRFWEALGTDWVCLDGEVMPWSFKAQGLLRQQYAPVGAAGRAASTEA